VVIDARRLRAGIPAFDGLPDGTLSRIAALVVERKYARGAVLFRSGSTADGLYFVLSGRVHVSRETRSRSEFLHAEAAGGVLGEIPAFGGGPFPATARAVAATTCGYLSRQAIERLLTEDPGFARFAVRRLAERAMALLRRIDELTATTITSRLADYLLDRYAASDSDGFTLGMSQEALASELGTAREVVVRGLAALVRSGAIARSGRSRFTVRDEATLRAMGTAGEV
jgi:CRP-like cAMP-binding protein